jgi:hypothetical protein
MYTVDLYRRVRLACHHENLNTREPETQNNRVAMSVV